MLGKLSSAIPLFIVIWLAGCAVPQAVDVSGTPDQVLQKQLAAMNRWAFNGKLAVRTPEQSESVRVQWQQTGDAFDIHLAGPAGLKATRIYGKPGDVNFDQGEHHVNADSVEALSEQLIGWPLPATELVWWLRGLPAPAAPGSQIKSVGYAPEGWLAELSQGNWLIHFSNPQRIGKTVLPGRIEAVQSDVKIILIIKEWQAR